MSYNLLIFSSRSSGCSSDTCLAEIMRFEFLSSTTACAVCFISDIDLICFFSLPLKRIKFICDLHELDFARENQKNS